MLIFFNNTTIVIDIISLYNKLIIVLMQVLNFNSVLFDEFLSKNVSDILDKDNPCLVIGIKEGGMPLAKIVVEKLQEYSLNKIDFVGVLCQRSSTKIKKNKKTKFLLKKTINIFPEVILNKLRVLEHSFLINNNRNKKRNVFIPNTIDFNKYSKILIVDDAVDTGSTMKNVIESINNIVDSNVDIKTLSVVLTNLNASVIPDYYLYSDVLIRFPWSIDGKKSNF